MRKKKPLGKLEKLEELNHCAAGIDVGSESHWVAVSPNLTDKTVREFPAHTAGITALADWLASLGVETVAMESTGVYWVPLFDLLEQRGLKPVLVDARATKQVAGRKTDVSDSQWIQQLHAYGLLKPAFIPDDNIRAVRAYMRQRDRWIQESARCVHRMQQALELMNIKLTSVVSTILGATGLAIIDAIIAGERDPKVLSERRDKRCKRTKSEIAHALHGTWREDQLFALKQARRHFSHVGEMIHECDQQIAAALRQALPANGPPHDHADTPNITERKRDQGPHPFGFDAQTLCAELAGVDLTSVNGIAPNLALTILAEIGTDVSAWPNAKAFTAWLGLAPNNRVSGGRRLRSKPVPNASRCSQAFRLAARACARAESALGAYYRRLRARLGPACANKATARKIAELVYKMIAYKRPYHDTGQAEYDRRFLDRRLANLKRQARAFGYELQPAAT